MFDRSEKELLDSFLPGRFKSLVRLPMERNLRCFIFCHVSKTFHYPTCPSMSRGSCRLVWQPCVSTASYVCAVFFFLLCLSRV